MFEEEQEKQTGQRRCTLGPVALPSFGFGGSSYIFFSFWCYFEPKVRGEELRLGSVLKLKTCNHLSSVLLDSPPNAPRDLPTTLLPRAGLLTITTETHAKLRKKSLPLTL